MCHVSAHDMARFATFIFTVFYCNVWRTHLFDNLTVKEFNLHWCESNFWKPAEKKDYLVSAVQIRDRPCATLTFLCYPRSIQIVFAILRYFVQLQSVLRINL